jgi:hypothetical protein
VARRFDCLRKILRNYLTLLFNGHKKASKFAYATDEFDPNGSALLLT